MAGVWTSVWGSHMLSEFDQPMNLTRYHSFPHLNLESKISSTLYSSVTPVTHHPLHTHVRPISELITSYGYDQMSTHGRLKQDRTVSPGRNHLISSTCI